MRSTKAAAAPALAERILAEIICSREEAAGHPADSAQADEHARTDGGDFLRRVCTRARHLTGSPDDLARIRRTLRLGCGLLGALLLLALIAGMAATVSALPAAGPVSLPLVLLLLVGLNAATLFVWLVAQPLFGRLRTGLSGVWRWLIKRDGRHAPGRDDAQLATMQLLAGPSRGRWLAAVAVHAAWLTYTLAGLATLSVLLSFKTYDLTWETTLLSPLQLSGLARFLSAGPGLLGAAGSESLPLMSPMSDADRQGWALWMLSAIAVYGALPRLVALLACAIPVARTLHNLARDTSRAGFARLRGRLLPDHVNLGPDSPGRASAAPATPIQAPTTLPPGPIHFLGVECDAFQPDDGNARWIRLGNIDGVHSRNQALQRLGGEALRGLVVVVRASATPDRGVERVVGTLARAHSGPTWLAVDDVASLAARGSSSCARRLSDWAALANRAGCTGGFLEWPPHAGELRPLPASAT